ncbi:UDP-2,3-diacylglucosamine diphosphatase [Legionella sp. km772]|uniref:UDP-2,3-diacylglucosamine diphosphatase n=1 Tax=Legionella sp. km772 TaxID=2498111 RepID=UPI000F8D121D|nr:UDP-2,3-diacylglucosamine diphosphatase [Legionella sp. km772]RUR12811.1 UDP-2,3-diacylglucosamine diphosphatase [Legionella sp. km772]
MIEAVFISDLHLHPQRDDIQARFDKFIAWCKTLPIKKIYILGDFFHAWAGDDSIDEWSLAIAKQLQELVQLNIQLFYMHGNRDFLLGSDFAKLSGWTPLSEPTLIELGGKKVLLVHGDRYCIKDKAHQRFRLLTRNRIFSWLFLCLPLAYRLKLVNKVRQISQNNQHKAMEAMDVSVESLIKHMRQMKVKTLIHGHTHKQGMSAYEGGEFKRYVLSDWDDMPRLLCYDNTNEYNFDQSWFLRVEK